MLFKPFRQPYLDAPDEIGGGSDGFDDVVEESSEDSMEVEEVATETEQSTEKVETPSTESEDAQKKEEQPKFKIKFNHQEEEISYEDAVPLIQKGRNYDKLQERLNELQSNPALSKYSKVQEVSALLGYQTDDELIEALYQTHYQRTAEEKGLTPAQVRKEHELAQKEKSLTEKETAAQKQARESEMYSRFAENFPDVKAEMIKPETWVKVNAGMDLTTAYTQQVNEDLQNELKILKQNQANSKKAPISSVSKHGAEPTVSDPFLEGFDED